MDVDNNVNITAPKKAETKKVDVTNTGVQENSDGKTSIFTRGEGANSAKITIIDTDGDGIDNNDTIKFEGNMSLFTPDEIKGMMKNYKGDDARTGLSLNELKATDDKKIKTEIEKDYSVGSFMKLFNSSQQTQSNSSYNSTSGKPDPAVINAFQNTVSMQGFNLDGPGVADTEFEAMKYLLGLNGSQNNNNSSSTVNSSSTLTFADQAKDTTGNNLNNEDDQLNGLNNGREADRLWNLAHDRSKYNEGQVLPCREDDIPQDAKTFKTEDGTEYTFQGLSQYTTPGTNIKNYKAAYKSSSGKIAIITNDNDSNKNIPGSDDKFPRNFRRGVTFFNPKSDSSEMNEKIVPDPSLNKTAPPIVGVNRKEDKGIKMYSLHIDSGDSIEKIKSKMQSDGYSSDIIDKAVAALSSNGVIDSGTFTLAIGKDVKIVKNS